MAYPHAGHCSQLFNMDELNITRPDETGHVILILQERKLRH